MKKSISILVMLFVMSICLFGQSSDPGTFKFSWVWLGAILTAIYEAVARLVPTSKVWSIIGKVLEILTWLSNKFDRRK